MDRSDAKILGFLTFCLIISVAGLKFQIPIQEYISQRWMEFRKVLVHSLTLAQQQLMTVKKTLDYCLAPFQQQWMQIKQFLDYDKSGPWDPLRKIVVRENLKTYHNVESAWSMGGRRLFGLVSLKPVDVRLQFPVFKGF